MTEEGTTLAASRALYFSDLAPQVENVNSENGDKEGKRKPSYVGLSCAANGYTAYSPYNRFAPVKKISPPIQIPVSPPLTLDSVSLVRNQDSYQRSVTEFEDAMRDLSSGGKDMPDTSYFPKSHTKQIVKDGDGQSVETVTKFYREDNYGGDQINMNSNGHKPNLVTKQIERIYGDSIVRQVRLTSPETETERIDSISDRNGDDNGVDNNDSDTNTPERKISGGFFAKRFGIIKMKDRSTRKLIDTNQENNKPMEFKPLKVPSVFKLLRPEFREQLKQSSCRVPLEHGPKLEHVIPIKREGGPDTTDNVAPKRVNGSSPGPHLNGSSPGLERVVPIRIVNGKDSTNTPATITNGVNNNNNNNVTPNKTQAPVTTTSSERIIPIRRESGEITATPKRHAGFAPKVTGFNTGPKVNGFAPKVAKPLDSSETEKIVIVQVTPRSNDASPVRQAEATPASGKPAVVRKLSNPAQRVAPGEKPTPNPKPDYLKSPPTSPTPRTSSPPLLSPNKTSKPLPHPKPISPPVSPPNGSVSPHHEFVSPTNGTISPIYAPSSPPESLVSNQESAPLSLESFATSVNEDEEEHEQPLPKGDLEDEERTIPKNEEEEEYLGDEYQQDYYYGDQPLSGIRERELLCPIMEEDNESTASGSIQNLSSQSHQTVIGSGYSPDDPLLLSEKGEVQDGYYFIKVLENETFKFEEKICDYEEDLNSGVEMPDEVRDCVLAGIGMAKLLMAQKLAQFRGLCDKNINTSRAEDPYRPTCRDLAGFWDMVFIQVEHIHFLFSELKEMRENGWKMKSVDLPAKSTKTKPKKNVGVNKPIKPKVKSEAAKARDDARKKMLEDRKRAMKLKQKNQDDQETDEGIMIIM